LTTNEPSERPRIDHVQGEYVRTQGAARILGVSEGYLNKARMTGDGPPYAKFSAAIRYHIPTLRAWAASKMRTSTSDERS